MTDVSHSIACLDTRIRKLENQILDYHKHEFEVMEDKVKEIVEEISEPIVPERLDRKIHEGIELLIKELDEKAQNIQILTDEITAMGEEVDDDILTVATEEALDDVGCLEDLNEETVVKIHQDCHECLKKKVKVSKTLKRDKKRADKQKVKKLKEQQLKIVEEEQTKLSLRLLKFD